MTFPTNFSGPVREVEILGEAFFEVAHDKSKPFRVHSHGQVVEVFGTHFDINSYSDEKLLRTTLLEGRIAQGIGPDGHMIFEKDASGNDLQTIIGNPIPSLTYGANVNLSYKNFDFSMSFQGVSGNQIFATTLYQIGNFSYSANNQIKSIYQAAGVTAPSVAVANGTDYAASTWFVYDGSFLRMRSAQLGYSLSTHLLNKIKVTKCRFYLSGQNLFSFDKYNVGLNPEVGAFNQNNTAAGVDQGTYPSAKIIPRA